MPVENSGALANAEEAPGGYSLGKMRPQPKRGGTVLSQ